MNKLFDSTSLPAKETIAPPTKAQMLRGEMTTMFLYQRNDENIPTDTEACYEAVASQEEISLEETEEELRMILACDDPPPPQSESSNQQRQDAAEELITGDSDDPPLSEEAVEEILENDSNIQRFKQI
jgi:hypothetical protein